MIWNNLTLQNLATVTFPAISCLIGHGPLALLGSLMASRCSGVQSSGNGNGAPIEFLT